VDVLSGNSTAPAAISTQKHPHLIAASKADSEGHSVNGIAYTHPKKRGCIGRGLVSLCAGWASLTCVKLETNLCDAEPMELVLHTQSSPFRNRSTINNEIKDVV
jgi:hypothetical protein